MPHRESSGRGVMRDIRATRPGGNKIFTGMGHNCSEPKQEPPQ
jgi:hypothetical protein